MGDIVILSDTFGNPRQIALMFCIKILKFVLNPSKFGYFSSFLALMCYFISSGPICHHGCSSLYVVWNLTPLGVLGILFWIQKAAI